MSQIRSKSDRPWLDLLSIGADSSRAIVGGGLQNFFLVGFVDQALQVTDPP
jgi:hypothetical protein